MCCSTGSSNEKRDRAEKFLGLANYYGRFLPDLSTRVAPLHVLLRILEVGYIPGFSIPVDQEDVTLFISVSSL